MAILTGHGSLGGAPAPGTQVRKCSNGKALDVLHQLRDADLQRGFCAAPRPYFFLHFLLGPQFLSVGVRWGWQGRRQLSLKLGTILFHHAVFLV